MSKPHVIIADMDVNYIIPLQLKFVKEFLGNIDLEVITDKAYFEEMFTKPQKAEILIVSEDMYTTNLQKHNIANIFLMTEQPNESEKPELNVTKMFKYTGMKEIFTEIISISAGELNIEDHRKKETQVILVTSASGGTGKTTLAMGISACLTKNHKKVLYINADYVHSFESMLNNKTAITSPDTYRKLAQAGGQIYSEIKHVIRMEKFNYLPPFKAALMSLGIDFSVYEKLVLSVKESTEYDYIIIDTTSVFDLYKARLMDISDKVIVVTEQSMNSACAASAFVMNVNEVQNDKYIFVCNKFQKDEYNALTLPEMIKNYTINHYIERFPYFEQIDIDTISNFSSIRQISLLLV